MSKSSDDKSKLRDRLTVDLTDWTPRIDALLQTPMFSFLKGAARARVVRYFVGKGVEEGEQKVGQGGRTDLAFEQIMCWLKLLSTAELFAVTQEVIRLMMTRIPQPEPASTTIAQMISALSMSSILSVEEGSKWSERLQEIAQGSYPQDHELVLIGRLLDVPTKDLMEIRARTLNTPLTQQSDPDEEPSEQERQPNGH